MLGKIASDHVAMLISAIAYMCLDQNRTKCVFGHSPFLFCFISLFPHIRISHLLEHVSIYVWKTTIVIKLKSFDMGISCAYYCTHLNIIYIYIYIYVSNGNNELNWNNQHLFYFYFNSTRCCTGMHQFTDSCRYVPERPGEPTVHILRSKTPNDLHDDINVRVIC